MYKYRQTNFVCPRRASHYDSLVFKLVLLILTCGALSPTGHIAWAFTQCTTLSTGTVPLLNETISLSNGIVPENTTAISCMTTQEAWITFERYMNEDVIWSRPKCLLCGNFVGASPAENPNLYPDRSSTYFVFNIHWEGNLTLTGQFPNARYVSFTAANQLGSGQLGNGNYIRGDQIIPDPGSSNPFISSNSRNVTDRN